jgi:hypothetical protein
MILGVSGRIGSGKDLIGKIIQELCLGHNSEEIVNSIKIGAGTIEQREDSGWQIKKFADKLKDIVCLLIGCTRLELEDQDFKNTELGEEWWYWKKHITGEIVKPYTEHEINDYLLIKLTPRLLLQLLGTECGRDIIHPSIWVNALMNEYKGKQKGYYTGRYFSKCEDCGEHLWGVDKRQKTCEKCSSKVYYPSWLITDMRFPNEYDAVKARGGISIRVNRPCFECNEIYQHKMSCSKSFQSKHPSETSLDNHKFDYEIINDKGIPELIEKVRQILLTEKII